MKKSIIAIFIFIAVTAFGFWFLGRGSAPVSEQAHVQKSTHTSEDALSVIVMKDDGYISSRITIKKGTTVYFKNQGKDDRWPASNIHPTHEIYPEFDSQKPLVPGSEWSFAFDKTGTWYFHDHLSPEITGSIIVE